MILDASYWSIPASNSPADLQAALSAGKPGVLLPSGLSVVGALTVPPTVEMIQGSLGTVLQQAAVGQNVLNIVSSPSLRIAEVHFVGAGGATSQSSNSAVFAADGTDLTVERCKMEGFCHKAVWAESYTDVVIEKCRIWNCFAGVHFRGVKHGDILRNTISLPMYGPDVFTTGIQLDSGQTTDGGNENCTVAHNRVLGFRNSQAVLLHDLQVGLVHHNALIDCMMGVSANGLGNSTDALSDLTIDHNIVQGTVTPFANPSGGALIQVAGASVLHPATRIHIGGNIVSDGNAILQDGNTGAIQCMNATVVSMSKNIVARSRANGMVIGPNCSVVSVKGNVVDTVYLAGGQAVGIHINSELAGTVEGIVAYNRINNVIDVLRNRANNAPNLIFDRNVGTLYTGVYCANPAWAVVNKLGA